MCHFLGCPLPATRFSACTKIHQAAAKLISCIAQLTHFPELQLLVHLLCNRIPRAQLRYLIRELDSVTLITGLVNPRALPLQCNNPKSMGQVGGFKCGGMEWSKRKSGKLTRRYVAV